ncbi:uncharacterized protein LOC143759233 isoform X1 [Ranitomeya variabilis]|uniref:uncharacterized protein LOC143759233 isoform X1 n=1 Tax=Ranitomeya variabilis TaxID=490064 RepID=UPI00405796FA
MTGTLEECKKFVADLNTNSLNIHLTSTISESTVDFLDIKLTIKENRVSSCLYRKKTATNNLLHYSSFHPTHLKNGIPKGQFLRLRRNCSSTTDFHRLAKDLTTRFTNRQYPKKIVSRAFKEAEQKDRQSLFTKQVRDSVRPLSLITTYNNQWSDIYGILNKNWNILLCEPKLSLHIASTPKVVARRAKNLKDQLCHSHYQRPKRELRIGKRTRGTYPCGGCNICQFLVAREQICISTLPFPIKSESFFNCRSRNLVYAILCDCPKLYVGQTSQELRKRCQQHLSNISLAKRDREKGKTLTSVAAHFLEAHGSNIRGLKIMGLEGINETIRGGNLTNQLLRCESKWIYKLRSLSPVGLNEELLFTGYYKQL